MPIVFVEIKQESLNQLNQIQDHTMAETQGEVIENALTVFQFIVTQSEVNARMVFERSDGSKVVAMLDNGDKIGDKIPALEIAMAELRAEVATMRIKLLEQVATLCDEQAKKWDDDNLIEGEIAARECAEVIRKLI